MQTLSDVYNGRIVIVGSNFRVVTDTFNLATGKYYLSEEVIKCFKGENSSHYNKDMQYFAQTIPVYDTADAKSCERSHCGYRIHGEHSVPDR